MFEVVEYCTDGREIIHGYDDTFHNAELRYDYVLTMGRVESFSIIMIKKAG